MTMKRAFLLHGVGGNETEYFWFADTKAYLEANGYEVWWPALPNPDRPRLDDSLYFLENNHPGMDEETILIGHSSACPLILSFLQNAHTQVSQVVLVAGYYERFEDKEIQNAMLGTGYDWSAIRQSAKEIIMINSDNDPWGCTDLYARNAMGKLHATMVVATGQGHMGSDSFKQPYAEFPILKRLLKV